MSITINALHFKLFHVDIKLSILKDLKVFENKVIKARERSTLDLDLLVFNAIFGNISALYFTITLIKQHYISNINIKLT